MRSAVDANVGSAPDRLSLVWCRVENTPKAGRNLGSARNIVRGGSLVTFELVCNEAILSRGRGPGINSCQ